MAENKKSFIAYSNWDKIFSKLTDAEAGKLFKHILAYVNDRNPEFSDDDRLLDIVFEPIKIQLKDDLVKWEKYVEKQKANGSKGGRPKTQTIPENPSLSDKTQKTQAFFEKPKKADYVDVDVLLSFINKTFVSIKNLDEFVSEFPGNKPHFVLAYKFWKLWYDDNPNSRTHNEANIGKWTDSVRKLIELDRQPIERLVGILCYFTKSQADEAGYDKFWFNTIKTVESFRKKDKEGAFYIDKIIGRVNEKREKDPDFRRYSDSAIAKFKEKYPI